MTIEHGTEYEDYDQDQLTTNQIEILEQCMMEEDQEAKANEGLVKMEKTDIIAVFDPAAALVDDQSTKKTLGQVKKALGGAIDPDSFIAQYSSEEDQASSFGKFKDAVDTETYFMSFLGKKMLELNINISGVPTPRVFSQMVYAVTGREAKIFEKALNKRKIVALNLTPKAKDFQVAMNHAVNNWSAWMIDLGHAKPKPAPRVKFRKDEQEVRTQELKDSMSEENSGTRA